MSPAWYRSALTVAILGGMAACGGEGGAGLDAPDRTLAWQKEVLYEVGGADAEGWAAFGRIVGVGFDAEGRLYVLDSQAKQVHVLGPDGTLERSMGTPGEGPGELGNVAGLTVFPDGTVSIFDFSKFSMVVYGPDGKWLRDVRVDPMETGLLTPPLHPTPYHTVLAAVGGIMRMRGAERTEPEEPGKAIIGVPLDEEAGGPTVVLRAWEPPPPEGSGETTTMRTEGRSFSLAMPQTRAFTPALRLAVLLDGRILTADTTTYRIGVYAADGTFQEYLGRPIAPVAVTSDIEEKERTNRLAALDSSGGPTGVVMFSGGGGGAAPDLTEMMRKQLETMVFYPEIQVIEGLAADWTDRIWVQRSSGEPGEQGPTDVITADGEYLGTLPPDGLRIPRAFGPDDLAVWIEKDEYDAERVVVARIVPAQN